MTNIEELRTMTIKEILTVLVTALVTMLGTIWFSIQDPLAEMLSAKVPKSILLLLPIILLLLLILALSLVFILYNKLKNPINDYEFDQDLGILRNPKDGLYYCTSCLLKGIKSPLRVYDASWECQSMECKRIYRSNSEKKPSFQKIYRRNLKNYVTDW